MNIGISMDAYLCPSEETIKKLSKAGFDALDFNLSDFCYEGTPLLAPDYENWFRRLKETANEYHMSFSQVHAPFHHVIGYFPQEALFDELTERCFTACEIMDIPYAVFHPMYFDEGTNNENYQQTLEHNINRMEKWANAAKAYHTSVALENIFQNMFNSKKQPVTTFGADINEIIAVVDSVDSDNIGVCLDTGHAHCTGINPAKAAIKLGERLKVLHVHDNNGNSDWHVAPFVGTIDWAEFMESLKSIKFDRTFSLEIHNYVQRMPVEIRDDAVLLSLKIAKHLCSQ